MRSEPPQIVAIQLKIFTPVGIAISIEVMANAESATGPIPVANIWCPQTPYDRNAIRQIEYAIMG